MSGQADEQELNDLEAGLRTLVPSPGSLRTDALMYRAGVASMRARLLRWRAAAAIITVACCGLGAAWYVRPATVQVRYVERTIPVEKPAASSSISGGTTVSDDIANGSRSQPSPRTLDARPEPPVYLRDRDLALRLGVEAVRVPVGQRSSFPQDDEFRRQLMSGTHYGIFSRGDHTVGDQP